MTILLPAGWEAAHAPVATALARCGPSLAWWLVGAKLLAAGIALASRRPDWSLALAVAAALALGVSTDGLVDDAYIQFRHAANLAAGSGPVFNPGERIEGASGGAWIGALALGPSIFRVDPGVWGRLLSLALTGVAVFAAGRAVRAAAGPGAGALAALLWATIPTTSLYAATGLETAAFAVALWLAAWAVVSARPRLPWLPGVAAAALRPETVVLAPLAPPWLRRHRRPARAGVLGGIGGAAARRPPRRRGGRGARRGRRGARPRAAGPPPPRHGCDGSGARRGPCCSVRSAVRRRWWHCGWRTTAHRCPDLSRSRGSLPPPV